ncbi:MAG TPA: hypothetical protein VFZ78_07545 [Flavisolibacter sp.]
MRQVYALLLACLLTGSSLATSVVSEPNPIKKASEIFLPIGNTGKLISLQDLSDIGVKEYEALSGQKMKAIEKIGFKLAQRDLRKSIASDGTIKDRKLAKRLAPGDGFHLGGFALGFFLGLIGVLIAYVISDDNKSARVKWSWIGLGAAIVLYLLIFVLL